MANRVYSMNEDEMNRLASELGRAISKNSDASSTMSRNFTRVNEGGLMGNTINALSKNMEKVNSIGTNIRRTIINQTSSTFEMEHDLTNKLESMDTPTDFVKNDTRKYNSIDDIQLSKKDDKSVNEGQETEKVNEIDDNSIQDEEQLYNLTKEETKQVDEIADNSIQDEEKLYNLTGEEAKEFNEIKDNSIQDEEKLYNLTGEQSKEFNEIDDNSITDEEKLKNITGEEAKETEEVEIDAIKAEKQLKEANTNATEQVEYEQGNNQFASTGSSIGNMGSSGGTASQESSEEGFNYTPSNTSEKEKNEDKEKEEKEKDSTLNDMMSNLSTYQNMERVNQETEKNIAQQKNNY